MSYQVPEVARVPFFNVPVTPLTAQQTSRVVRDAILRKRKLWISNYNLHAVYLGLTDSGFDNYCRTSDISLIDGWPILSAARLGNKAISADFRVGSTDWLNDLLKGEDPITVVAIGGTIDACRRSSAFFNNLRGVNWHAVDGYVMEHQPLSGAAHSLPQLIAESDLVLVGLGMPLQEHWILRNAQMLSDKVVANVGGCIDYYAGVQKLAPRRIGAYGLEWLYRLVQDPRRLWKRYLIEPIKLVVLLLRHRKRER